LKHKSSRTKELISQCSGRKGREGVAVTVIVVVYGERQSGALSLSLSSLPFLKKVSCDQNELGRTAKANMKISQNTMEMGAIRRWEGN